MVNKRRIAREEIFNLYIYVSSDPVASRNQIIQRTTLPQLRGLTAEDPMFIVDVLSYVIQHPNARSADTYSHYKNAGVSLEDIEAIYARYVMGKKN